MKIGIAVEADNKTITVRTGHAPAFAIFTLHDGQIIENGISPNEHVGHQHEHEDHHTGDDQDEVQEHRNQLGELKSCDAIIVRGIGPSMKQALFQEGVKIFRATKSLGNEALELVQRFSKNPDDFITIE